MVTLMIVLVSKWDIDNICRLELVVWYAAWGDEDAVVPAVTDVSGCALIDSQFLHLEAG
jgi:hypothetical protein